MIIHRSIVTEELALTAPTELRPCKKKGKKGKKKEKGEKKKKKDESVAPIKKKNIQELSPRSTVIKRLYLCQKITLCLFAGESAIHLGGH